MAKDYLKIYQEGGPMPEGGAPAPEGGGGSPEEMLAAVVQTQDPVLALEFCNKMAAEMGIAPGGGAPAEPTAAPEPAPMGKYGMKLPKIQL